MPGGRRRRSQRPLSLFHSDRISLHETHMMSVSLDVLYNGGNRDFKATVQVICPTCRGKGGQLHTCAFCNGSGLHDQVQRQEGFATHVVQSPCRHCRGQGENIAPTGRCPNCEGQRTVAQQKTLTVNIERGMKDGQKIVFLGQGSQAKKGSEIESGNLTIILNELKYEDFKRFGDDLLMEMDLSRMESFFGFQRVIKALDNRKLFAVYSPDREIKTGDTKFIKNEGMPVWKCPDERGKLIIKFNVDSLGQDDSINGAEFFSGRIKEIVPADIELVKLIDYPKLE